MKSKEIPTRRNNDGFSKHKTNIVIGVVLTVFVALVLFLYTQNVDIGEFGKGQFFGGGTVPSELSVSVEDQLDTFTGNQLDVRIRVAGVSGLDLDSMQVVINYPDSISDNLQIASIDNCITGNFTGNNIATAATDDEINFGGGLVMDTFDNHIVDGYVELCTLHFDVVGGVSTNVLGVNYVKLENALGGLEYITPNDIYVYDGKINIIAQAPVLTLPTDPIAFGNVSYNTTSDPIAVQIQNTGNANMEVTNISISDPAFNHDFTESLTIPAEQSRSINVTFAPTDDVDYSATLTVETTEGLTPNTIALTGSGVNDSPTFVGAGITLTKTDHNGDVEIVVDANDINSDQIYYKYIWTDTVNSETFTHPSTGWIATSSDTLTDVDASFEPGDSWNVEVQITDNQSNTDGTSVNQDFSFGTTELQFQDSEGIEITSLNFSDIAYNDTAHDSLTIRLINPSLVGFTIDNVYLNDESEFTIATNNCTDLNAGEFCSLIINFDPTAIGSYIAILNVDSSDLTETAMLPITAEAINEAPDFTVSVTKGDLLTNVMLEVFATDSNNDSLEYRYHYSSGTSKSIYHPSAESFTTLSADYLTPTEANFMSNEIWDYNVTVTDEVEAVSKNGTFAISETADGQSPIMLSSLQDHMNYIGIDNTLITLGLFPTDSLNIPLWIADQDGSETISTTYTNTNMTFDELVGDVSDSITIDSPLDQELITATTISINGSVADTTETSIDISVENLTGDYNQATSSTLNQGVFTHNFANLTDGVYQIKVDDGNEIYDRYFYSGSALKGDNHPNIEDYTHKAYKFGYTAGTSSTSLVQSFTLTDNYNNSSTYEFEVMVIGENDYPNIVSVDPISTSRIDVVFDRDIEGDDRVVTLCNTTNDLCDTLSNSRSVINGDTLEITITSTLASDTTYSVNVTGVTTSGSLNIPVLPEGVTGTFETTSNPTVNRGNCDGSVWVEDRGVIEFNDILLALRYTVDQGDPSVIAKKNSIESNCNLVINNNSWHMPNIVDMNDVLAVLSFYLLEGEDGFISNLQQTDVLYIARAIQKMKEHDDFWPTNWDEVMSSEYIGYNVVNPVFPYDNYEGEFTSQSIRISARLENDEVFERVIYNN